MKDTTKTYIVFSLEIQDEPPIIKRLNGEEIRKLCTQGYQGNIAIVDGNLLKSWENKIDLTKL
jgi:hypothetical protein